MKQLQDLRKKLKVTQREMANRLGMNNGNLSSLENEKITMGKINQLKVSYASQLIAISDAHIDSLKQQIEDVASIKQEAEIIRKQSK